MTNDAFAPTSSEQCCLVQQVGDVGTRETRSAARHHVEIHIGAEGLALGVNFEDALTALKIGFVHHDLTIEAARTKQCGIQDVGPVGGGDEDDADSGVEAVHFHQHLVQGLLALVVSAAHTCSTMTTDGVNFIDEDDGRGTGLGLLEQVAYPTGTNTDKHLYEVRAGYGEEWHPGFACHCFGQQCLAGSGRTVEQNAFRNLGPDGCELGRVFQELFDFPKFDDGLIGSGHIGKRGLRRVLVDRFCACFTELHDSAAATLRGVDEPHEEADHEHEWKEVDGQV